MQVMARELWLLSALAVSVSCAPSVDNSELEGRVEILQARVEAMEARLAELPDEHGLSEASITELLARLGSSDAVKRYRAIRELGARGGAPWQDLFIMLDGGNHREREGAAAVFAGNADETIVTQLLIAHEAEQDPKVRAILATALSRIDTPNVVDALLEDFGWESHLLRIAAIRGLGRLQSPRAAGPLLQVALSGEPLVAAAASEALHALDDRAFLFFAAEWELLDSRERADAIVLLGQLRGESVEGFLRERLRDASPVVALTAARALAELGNPVGQDLARNRLGSDDPVVARLAREVLDLTGNTR
jgi:HEAT repeat protein